MTKKEFAKQMKAISDQLEQDTRNGYPDEEEAHILADILMCKLLKDLGYGEAVDIFEKMPKMYA